MGGWGLLRRCLRPRMRSGSGMLSRITGALRARHRWESLFDRSAGTAAAAVEALKRVPRQAWEEKEAPESPRQQAIWQRRTKVEQHISLAMIGAIAKKSFFKQFFFRAG